ncbi:VWA domain-containing protein [Halosquirtibacter xylanolyticus]|uniref:VWA domain-containing protein n=1 Tax=Halosquirtibacter xylanolyticus TaxID=3374599 RepID=UPI00374A83B7|nr:VWA domain-containing protein [Prolixibacteraceae bacterium]
MNNAELITYLNQFHFLRPRLLWFLLPMLLLLIYFFFTKTRDGKWEQIIRPEYRIFVISNAQLRKLSWPALIYFSIFTLAIIGLAGPTFSQKQLPKVVNQSEVMIALDLSQSMMTIDIPPNRLERAKLKIRDLFDLNLNTKIGLLAYAGTTHTIFPPSQDKEIMVPYMTSIKPRIMPIPGSNYPIMINNIDTIFTKIEAPSTILLLTDELSSDNATQLSNYINKSGDYLIVWQISSQQGGIVPSPKNPKKPLLYNKEVVKSIADPAIISSLQINDHIWVVPITLDDTDTKYIGNIINQHRVIQSASKEKSDIWRDVGPWFLIPCLFLGLLWFRKGWVIGWCILILPSISSCSLESKHSSWWYSDNYRAENALINGDYETAAKLFDDPSHKAYAYYKSGDLDNATTFYAMDTTAQSKYNLGLIYAQKGDFLMAQKSMEMAIQKDPQLSVANQKLEAIKTIIENTPQLLKEQQKEKKRSTQEFSKVEEMSQKDQKLADKDYNANRDTTDNSHDKVYSDKHKYKEVDWPQDPKDKDKQLKNRVQASSLLMEKSNSDPSEFLRKKFILQKKKHYPNIKKGEKTW